MEIFFLHLLVYIFASIFAGLILYAIYREAHKKFIHNYWVPYGTLEDICFYNSILASFLGVVCGGCSSFKS